MCMTWYRRARADPEMDVLLNFFFLLKKIL